LLPYSLVLVIQIENPYIKKQLGLDFFRFETAGRPEEKMSEQESFASSSEEASSQGGPGGELLPKLPYFHRTLSQEDQELLRANAGPKPIAAVDIASAEVVSSTSGKQPSAWNAAGSWEERDCTQKCKALFLSIIQAEEAFASLVPLGLVVRSASVDSGHANITHTRGKVGFLYEFALSMRFELSLPGSSTLYQGTIKIEDLGNDISPGEFEIGVEWQDRGPTGTAYAESKAVIQGNKNRETLFALLKQFEESWRQSEQ